MAGENAPAPAAADPAAPEPAAPETPETPPEPEVPEAQEGDGPHGPEDPGEGEEAAETDWKASSRRWEGRAKANKAKADANEARIAELEAQIARAGTVAEVAREKGVDASLLARMAGDTAEQIAENADALLAFARAGGYPDTPDQGAGRGAAITAEQIMAERNPVERARLMGANKHLFLKD